MKHPRIIEEIGRHNWAITESAMRAIMRAVESGVGPDDEVYFHHARRAISEELVVYSDSTGNTSAGFVPVPPPQESEYVHGERVGNVGVIRIEGPITPRASWLTQASGLTSVDGVSSDLDAMAVDPSIAKVLFVFDSPGGAVTGVSELAAQIRDFPKPTAGYVFGMAASAAYWLASATDRLVAADTADVGSIGVVCWVGVDNDAETVKIISSQSPRKHADPTTESGRAEYQQLIDATAQIFVDTVAANRGTTTDDVLENFGRGGMLIADAARERGMIDGVSTYRAFLAEFSAADATKSPRPGAPERLSRTSALSVDNPPIGRETLETTDATSVDTGAQGADEREEKMNLQELLAANADAKRELDAMVADARATAVAEFRGAVQLAVEVASGEKYPRSVRALAGQVILGTAEPAALVGAMSVVEISEEKKNSDEAVAASAALPATPAQAKDKISDDHIVRSEADFRAAVERVRGVR